MSATSSTPGRSKARDRLAELVLVRAKHSSSRGLTDDEMRATISSQMSEGKRASEMVSNIARLSPAVSTTSVSLPPPRPASETPMRSQQSVSVNRSKAPSAMDSLKALQSPPRFNVAPTPHIPIRAPKQSEDLWAVLAKQKDAELVEIKARTRAIHNEKLTQQKGILDEQCAIRKRRKASARAAHLAERSVVDTQKVRWDDEAKGIIEEHKEIALQIKSDREEQVEDRKKRRAKLEAERQAMDAAILKRMQAELAEEKKREQAARERQIRFREELIEANEAQKKIIAARKEQEAELEAAASAAYIARVEKEAEARNKAFVELKAKMKGREAMALALQATIEEKAAEDEARAERVTEARYQKLLAKERAEVEKKKRATQSVLDFRAMQLEIKKDEREEEKKRLAQEKIDAEEEVQDSKKKIQASKAVEKQKILNYREILEEQLKDNTQFNSVLMSEEEQKINTGMLYRARSGTSMSDDPSIVRSAF